MTESKEEKIQEKPKLSEFYNSRKISNHVNVVKFLLMPFVFFALLNFPISGTVGNYVTAISNFTALAFFIFCGFFTLVPDQERRLRKLKRALKRSWLFFLVLFISYLAINILYLAYIGQLKGLIDPEFLRIRTFFEFFVLNLWPLPVGACIWFIQSLAYAYLFFFVAEKLKLSKIYLPLLIVLLIFMLMSGEFAGIFRIPYFGYRYVIPGNFLTKTIPFMLIGMLLRKYVDKLARIPRFVYIITFFAGILLSVGELFLLAKTGRLAYTGNMIGYAIMALSVCCFAVTKPDIGESFLATHGGSYARRMYAFCEPISFLLWFLFRATESNLLPTIVQFSSVISLIICFALALVIGLVKFKAAVRRGDIEP